MALLSALAAKAFSINKPFSSSSPDFSGVGGRVSHVDGATTAAGTKIGAESSLRVAAIWIAVTVLADEVSSLVYKVVRRGDEKRAPVQPPELRALWGEPNPDQTTAGTVATDVLSLMLWGAAYEMLGWTNGGTLEIRWPIDPSRLQLDRMDDQGLLLRAAGQGELRNRPGRRPEFLFVPLYTLPGQVTPLSPVAAAAELAGLAVAYERTAGRLAGRGLNPSAILTASEPIPQQVAEELSERLTQTYGGPGGAGKVAVLGAKDLKLERLGMSMVDAQFVQLYEKVFQMLLAMWRVPPTVAGMVDKPSTWGTGVAEFARGLERFTLRPIVQRLQAGYEKHITRWVDEELQVRFRFDSMLSAAPKDRAEIQRSRLMSGMTSVERVLAQEDEPPFGEDETVYTLLALATEEDRRLERMRKAAEASAALIGAGVSPAEAYRMTGLDQLQ